MNNKKEKDFEELIKEAPHRYPISDMEIALIRRVFSLSRAIHSGLMSDEKGHYHRITETGLDFFTDLHNYLVDIIKEDEYAIEKMDYVIDLITLAEKNDKPAHDIGKGGAVDIFRNVDCRS